MEKALWYIMLVVLLVLLAILIPVLFSLRRQAKELRCLKEQGGESPEQSLGLLTGQLQQLNQQLQAEARNNRSQLEAVRQSVALELQHLRQNTDGSLAQVNRGLGEMQNLAGNVGELQKLLRNIGKAKATRKERVRHFGFLCFVMFMV